MEKGVSISNVRLENRRKLVKLLYKNKGLSKQNISVGMSLSMPTVNLLVSQLEEEGLIERRRADASSGGRIPDLLYFKYDAKFVVGVEIQQDFCNILIVDMAGREKAQKRVQARFNGSMTYWRGFRAIFLQMMEENGFCRNDILGIGIVMHTFGKETSRVWADPVLSSGNQIRLDQLDGLLGFPVMVERDVNAAGFANIWFSENLDQMIYLSISQQIGASIVVNRQFLHGENRRCGEIGHMTLVPGGAPCSCGRNGCAELYCSTSVLTKMVDGNLGDFFKLYQESEGLQKAWDSYTNHLAELICNMNALLDLPVMLGGDLGFYIDLFWEMLEQKVENICPFYVSRAIYPTQVRENAAAVGAALMIVEQYLNLGED